MTPENDRIESSTPDRWSTDEFQDVLAAARAGADRAWRSLVETYGPALLGYARLRGAAEPEDVLSEVWMAAAAGLHRFEGDEPRFRSWLFVIAHRRSIDEGRKGVRRPRATDPADIQKLSRSSTTSAETMALDALSLDGLDELLSSLTLDQRTVIALRFVADLSLTETARIMGKRVGAIKALQHRALEALRKEIAIRAYPNESAERLPK